MKHKFFIRIILLILISMQFNSLHAQDIQVPLDIQLKLLFKILQYNKNITVKNDRLVVGILYQSDFRNSFLAKDQINEISKEYSNSKILNKTIEFEYLKIENESGFRKDINSKYINVLLITPLRAIDLSQISKQTHEKDILTFSTVPEYLEFGLSVGIGLKDKKVEIMINLSASRAEGADFSSKLLKMSKIIGN